MVELVDIKNFKVGETVEVHKMIKFEYLEGQENSLPPEATILYRPDSKRRVKAMISYPIEPVIGAIMGWTVKRTGIHYPGSPSYSNINGYAPAEPPVLDSYLDDYHKVWVIQQITSDQRYHVPIYAVDEDIRKVNT